MTLSVPGVGPDHKTQICATHLQSLKKRTTSASTVAAKVTLQESAPADQMITERNQGQHPGTSRTAEWAVQVVKPVPSNINKDSHHQTRFDERYKRQYSPNYNNFQQSPLGSIPGQDLSATLIELSQHSVQITRSDGHQPEEPVGSISSANKGK